MQSGEVLPLHRRQLSAIAQTHELFTRSGIDYWLFGGWAVDFHVGSITRPHDDIDVAVWLDDHNRIAQLLGAEGWKHAPESDEDGGTGYERDAVRLELTFLVPGDGGEVYIPLRADRVLWSEEPLSTYFAEVSGVRARVLGLAELKRGKSRARDDPGEAAKDRADFDSLSPRLGLGSRCPRASLEKPSPTSRLSSQKNPAWPTAPAGRRFASEGHALRAASA